MPTANQKTLARQMMDASPEIANAVQQSDMFSKMKQELDKVTIDGTEFYIAEGDMLLDEDELGIYALRTEAMHSAMKLGASAASQAAGALLGETMNGRIIRWDDSIELTYCVLRKTFSNNSRYVTARENMRLATKDWEATCGIRFRHLDELDESDSVRPDGVIFPVREINAGGSIIAAAFFPHDPPSRWRVVIDPSYFADSLRYDRVGVLRHELGHVLGFRHEHIRSGAPAECPNESLGGTINLSEYDPTSVMHYFCGGIGDRMLAITELDRAGSQAVYGRPLSDYFFITPS